MRKLSVNSNEIVVFDDIEQLTAERFSKFNKFLMLSDSIGSSFADIDRVHLSRMYLTLENPQKMKDELNNLRLLIHNVINEINPTSMSFACLVSEINGKQFSDISDSGLEDTRKKVEATGITFSDLKKKSTKLGKK